MSEQGLISIYTVAQFKPTKTTCNESEIGNALNQDFNQDKELKVVVRDLTYVRVKSKWHYICVLLDLYMRLSYTILIVLNYSILIEVVSLKINLSMMDTFGTERSLS